MSKLYRSVWNEALGTWVAVAEIEGSCGTSAQCQQFDFKSSKPNFTLSRIMQATTLGLLASSANNALALPTALNVSPIYEPVTGLVDGAEKAQKEAAGLTINSFTRSYYWHAANFHKQ